MSFLTQLQLSNFRCYDAARIDGLTAGLIVLTGPNGAGKTNILEAVSLLTPGRGLRSASTEDLQRKIAILSAEGVPLSLESHQAEARILGPWSIAAHVETGGAMVQLGTGLDVATGKRVVRINGMASKAQIALSDYISCIWLTPQMDRLFLDSSGGRRRFFDKLVFTFDPGHAGRVTRYENAMAQRSKLLREGRNDPSWLKSLESQMAETGVAIAAARSDFAASLQKACNNAQNDEENFFPKAHIALSGTIEELLASSPAVQVEELFAYQLFQSRGRDSETGGAATGPHKTDLRVRYAAKDMPADQCSTGEQKALLIGLILAHARLMAAERGAPPILLLDEVAAHLDENRRAALFDLLIALGAQAWMTGTDVESFSAIQKRAQFWRVEQSTIYSVDK